MSDRIKTSGNYVTVLDAGPRGMVTVRGDLGDAKLQKAVAKIAGVDFPETGRINLDGARGLAWMSPDELLLLAPHGEVAKTVAELGKALKAQHHLVADVSDARAVFRLEGAACREVLAKLTPADVSASAFGPGMIRRSRLAQVAGAFWMSDAETAEIVCFRSVAVYVRGLLDNAARAGAEVHYPLGAGTKAAASR